MSVRKGERKEGKLQVLNACRELTSYTMHILKNDKVFPKSYRWLITEHIAKECLEAHLCIRHANSIYPQKATPLQLQNKRWLRNKKRKLRKILEKEKNGEIEKGTAKRSINGMNAHALQGNTYKMRHKLTEWFKENNNDYAEQGTSIEKARSES